MLQTLTDQLQLNPYGGKQKHSCPSKDTEDGWQTATPLFIYQAFQKTPGAFLSLAPKLKKQDDVSNLSKRWIMGIMGNFYGDISTIEAIISEAMEPKIATRSGRTG